MMLIEEGALPQSALPVNELRDQLRLGQSDGGAADAMLAAHLRAAMAAIEGRTGKVLITRRFKWRFAGWHDREGRPLPLAPVATVHSVAIIDAHEVATTLDTTRWRLVPDMHRPRVVAGAGVLPQVPEGGWLEIDFTAGFAPDWSGVSADLKQAVMLLAARYHEDRVEGGYGGSEPMPFGVMALIERFRSVRILGGGRR